MLTDAELRNTRGKSKAYKKTDRDGLYVLVTPTGGIAFRYDYRFNGRRETVTFVREYSIGTHRRRFDATMILDENRIVDYLGTHQHLAVDLRLRADERGGLILESDAQRFYEGPIAFRFPMLFSGRARLHEWFDDVDGRFRVDLEVTNHRFGFLFGYRGSFECEWMPASDAPARLKPRRHEART